jgi:hypothetical protein
MNKQKEIIKQYFDSWINKKIDSIEKYFSDDIKYVECYGPEYHGINQIKQWFAEWNKQNNCLQWNIKQFIGKNNIMVVEWFFEYENNKIKESFDGVSIIEFNINNKIITIKEFQSKSEHNFPYDKI